MKLVCIGFGEVISLGRSEADLSRLESLRKVIRDVRPDVIVNVAVYKAVGKEELETVINAVAAQLKALMVHYSYHSKIHHLSSRGGRIFNGF